MKKKKFKKNKEIQWQKSIEYATNALKKAAKDFEKPNYNKL